MLIYLEATKINVSMALGGYGWMGKVEFRLTKPPSGARAWLILALIKHKNTKCCRVELNQLLIEKGIPQKPESNGRDEV